MLAGSTDGAEATLANQLLAQATNANVGLKQARDQSTCKVMFLKACKRRQRRKVINNNTLVFNRREALLTEAPDHTVDVRYAN
jgi:hypothetical protein